jgi:GH24 family phage-related lysozyme (muramidase)
MTDINSYKLSLTYQGAQPELKPEALGVQTLKSPDPADQVLDLSEQGQLVSELTHQDLSTVKAVKIGQTYLSAPDPALLKTLVEQLKSVCLDKKGALRKDFQYIAFAARVNPAAGQEPATTSLMLKVVGPEPNDGYLNLSQRDLIGGVHLIQPGDNLTHIARLVYGGTEADVLLNARRLANFNGFSDPNRIPSGKTLYLVDENLIGTISSTAPRAVSPGQKCEVPQVEPPQPCVPATAAGTRGAELYSENPPTLKGLLDFMGKDAYALIEKYEHSEDRMYWDGGQRGKGYPTIGVGHLIRPGEKFNGKNLMTARLTPAEIEQLFIQDLSSHIEPLLTALKPEVLTSLNRNQLTALASLAFNIGPGGMDRRGRKLGFKYSPVVTALNAGSGPVSERFEKAAEGFSRHIFSKGQRMQGLISRRLGERALFLRSDVDPAVLPGYDRRALKAFLDQLNQLSGLPQVKYADVWPPGRQKR